VPVGGTTPDVGGGTTLKGRTTPMLPLPRPARPMTPAGERERIEVRAKPEARNLCPLNHSTGVKKA